MSIIHILRDEFVKAPHAGCWCAVVRPVHDGRGVPEVCKAIVGCPKCGKSSIREMNSGDPENSAVTPFTFQCPHCSFKSDITLDGVSLPPIDYSFVQLGLGDQGNFCTRWTYKGGGELMGWIRGPEVRVDSDDAKKPPPAVKGWTDKEWYDAYPANTSGNAWVFDNNWQALDTGFGHPKS